MKSKKVDVLNQKRDDFFKKYGSTGNKNIMRGYIQQLDSSIRPRVISADNDKDFFCWLMLYSLFILIKLESKFYKRGENKDQNMSYAQLKDQFKIILRNSQVPFDDDRVDAAFDLRHSFVHFGLPNPVRIRLRKNTRILEIVERCTSDYFFAKTLLDEISALIDKIPNSKSNETSEHEQKKRGHLGGESNDD